MSPTIRGIIFALLFQLIGVVSFALAVAASHSDAQTLHPEQFTQGYDWRQPSDQR